MSEKHIVVSFKTLVPNSVKRWLYEKYDDEEKVLYQAKLRLKMKLDNEDYFKKKGLVKNIKIENKELIGYCEIHFPETTEEKAKSFFKDIFKEAARNGQKFKIISYDKK